MLLRLWLLVLLVCASAFASSRAEARAAENRTWVFLPTTTETRLADEPQAAGTHQENGLWNYEHAPGCTQAAETTAMRAGQLAEGPALQAIGSTGKVTFTPTAAQIDSAAFKVIVGEAKYTASGAPVSTIFDGAAATGLAEIKSGSSVLTSTYQLRLQTYASLISEQPFTIYTSRPVNAAFGDWLSRWGVSVKPLP